MNRQINQQTTTASAAQRPMPQRRRGPDPRLLSLLRGIMLFLGGAILAVGLMLIILPMFKVKKIEIVGNSYYTAEQIIDFSEIEIGQEILSVDAESVRQNIWDHCEYIGRISVKRSLSTVCITVSEKTQVMYTEFQGKYYSFDSDLRVIECCDSEDGLTSFLRVELPPITSLAIPVKCPTL